MDLFDEQEREAGIHALAPGAALLRGCARDVAPTLLAAIDDIAGTSGAPSISADGRYVVFESEASNLVLGDTNGKSDFFRVANPQFAHKFNSYASPTPVIEPGRIYVTFGSPGTAAVDTRTGKVIWQRDYWLPPDRTMYVKPAKLLRDIPA